MSVGISSGWLYYFPKNRSILVQNIFANINAKFWPGAYSGGLCKGRTAPPSQTFRANAPTQIYKKNRIRRKKGEKRVKDERQKEKEGKNKNVISPFWHFPRTFCFYFPSLLFILFSSSFLIHFWKLGCSPPHKRPFVGWKNYPIREQCFKPDFLWKHRCWG